MHVTLRMSLIAWTLLVAGCAATMADDSAPTPPVGELTLQIEPEGWGDAKPKTVEQLLHYTGRELLRQFPGRELDPIHVEPKGGPIVLFKRGASGEYRVKLNTGGLYWSQYAYQFSHELCHILCKYDEDPHHNDWFEESICELASLYTLRRMSETWQSDPPYPHWKPYAPHLAEYAQERIDKATLPAGMTLARWFREHEKTLYANATRRDLNNVVAVALLDLFEERPANWEAITWLNAATPTGPQTFEQYLQDWLNHAPERHRLFIRQIAARFGIALHDGA
ncbi:MAG: hypothetical protein GC159_18955 [Phycisphaera sp.]|nr:hypothetical protein [Phycisphaera sp.]